MKDGKPLVGYSLALEMLEKFGLLLLSDASLPSVAALVAGERIRGSWWGHPKGHEIFKVAGLLDEHPDVATMKLLNGKITFVHRSLWLPVVTVGRAREAWQLTALPPSALSLLTLIDLKGEVRTDDPSVVSSVRNLKLASRCLEERLLVQSQEFHTSTGAHAKRLESWDVWSKRAQLKRRALSVYEAKSVLDKALDRINQDFSAKGFFPWQSNPR